MGGVPLNHPFQWDFHGFSTRNQPFWGSLIYGTPPYRLLGLYLGSLSCVVGRPGGGWPRHRPNSSLSSLHSFNLDALEELAARATCFCRRGKCRMDGESSGEVLFFVGWIND